MTAGPDARAIVELGCRAPSVHNTQPWRWRIDSSRVELWADRARQLTVSDPLGRNLTISCGVALHHFQVAAAGLGREVSVQRFPHAGDPDLLAVLHLGGVGAVTPAAEALLEALGRRRTDRRRFTSWPVPVERLEDLAEVTQRRGARVFPVTGDAARATVERLAERAVDAQLGDTDLAAEQRAWIARSGDDGVPIEALPRQDHPGERRDRFDRGADPTRRRAFETSEGVLALCTSRDDPAAWLDTGETLSALWLRATRAGFSVVPLSQVVEVDATREALKREVFHDMAQPQLLVRIGWQEVTRPALPPTPRRPMDDVLGLVATPRTSRHPSPS